MKIPQVSLVETHTHFKSNLKLHRQSKESKVESNFEKFKVDHTT